MKKKYIVFFLSGLLLSACGQPKGDKGLAAIDSLELGHLRDSIPAIEAHAVYEKQMDKGEAWLRAIFKTDSSDKVFPSYNVEERLCTKRYQAFIAASAELYGPSNLTDAEFPIAEKKFKTKWSSIYPIQEQEPWLFGRGNGDIGELQELKISKIKDSLYRVFIDYGAGYATDNELLLVVENAVYKIDFCKTKFVD